MEISTKSALEIPRHTGISFHSASTLCALEQYFFDFRNIAENEYLVKSND